MQVVRLGQANILYHDLIAKASGNPITTGTVTFYLIAKSGDNAGKWFRASDSSWQASESSAGAGIHKSDGHWYVSVVSAAWIAGVLYEKYAKESGDLHISYSENVITDIDAIETKIDWIKNVTEGDVSIDTTTTPWQVVVKIKSTETELIRKDLKDKDGNNITSVNAMIGRYLEPS